MVYRTYIPCYFSAMRPDWPWINLSGWMWTTKKIKQIKQRNKQEKRRYTKGWYCEVIIIPVLQYMFEFLAWIEIMLFSHGSEVSWPLLVELWWSKAQLPSCALLEKWVSEGFLRCQKVYYSSQSGSPLNFFRNRDPRVLGC